MSAVDILKRFLGLIFSPVEAFTKILERPHWLVPLLILGLGEGLINLYVATRPWVLYLLAADIIRIDEDLSLLEAVGQVRIFSFLGIVTRPLLLFLEVLIIARVILFFTRSLGGKGNFLPLLAVVSYIRLIPFLGRICGYLFLFSRDLAEITSAGDLRIGLGLNLFSIFDRYRIGDLKFEFLQECNLFAMWHLILLSIGISMANKLKGERAFLVALLIFFSGVGLKIAWIEVGAEDLMKLIFKI